MYRQTFLYFTHQKYFKVRKCKRNSTYLTPRTPQGLMQNYWKVMYLAIREFVFQNTFVASCNFVCIPHFISVGQISSVFFSNKRKEFQWWKNSSKRRRQSSFRFTGRLLWLVSPKKYKLFSRKKIYLLFWNALYEFQLIRLWKFLLGAMLTLLIQI